MDTDVGDVTSGTDQVDRELEGRRYADRLDCDVGAQVGGELAYSGNRVLVPVVDDDVGAKLLRRVEPCRGHVNRHDEAGAEQLRTGDRRQPDGSSTDHDDDVARADPAVEDADLVRGGQDVREHQQLVVADTRRHGIGRAVRERDPDQLSLGAVDLVSEDPATTTEALSRVTLAAVAAGAAGRHAGHQDAVAEADVLDTCSDLRHGADRLVADDPAGRHRRDVTFEDVQVCAADRGGVDLHDGVGVCLQNGVGELLPGLDAGTVVNECLHG